MCRSRKMVSSVVYNYKLDQVTVFVTSVKNTVNGTAYILKAYEYMVYGGQLVQVFPLCLPPSPFPFSRPPLLPTKLIYFLSLIPLSKTPIPSQAFGQIQFLLLAKLTTTKIGYPFLFPLNPPNHH
jgi:hypothetical protein